MRYLHCCPGFLVMQKNDLIGKPRLISNFLMSPNNCNTHIADVSGSKSNHAMKLSQLIKHNVRNIILRKLSKKKEQGD